MYAKYCKLRDERGLNDHAISIGADIKTSTLYDWGQRAAINPNAQIGVDKLKKLADFFKVPITEFTEDDHETA